MLYFDFINPYITYMFVVLFFAFSVHTLFTKREWVTRNKKKIMTIAMILLIWTQFARYAGVFFESDAEWSFLIFNFRVKAFSWGTHLPFYICRLSVLVLLYYLITKDKRVESFLFYWGATGIAGVLYPNSSDIYNIYTLTETFFVDHFLLAITPFFLIVYQEYRPSRKDLLVITGLMFAILAMFIPINQFMSNVLGEDINVDYFYVKDQSIVKEIFGKLPSIVFVTIHTFVAYCFFSIYYFGFRNKEYEIIK